MQLTDDEKQLLKTLLKKELTKFTKEAENMQLEPPALLAVEKKYEILLKGLLQKLK